MKASDDDIHLLLLDDAATAAAASSKRSSSDDVSRLRRLQQYEDILSGRNMFNECLLCVVCLL
jgi:hypothetical protein